MRANQLRLWLASLAYVLVEAVRRLGLSGTEMANATVGSIRLKLLKIGAVVTVSVRRIKLAFAHGSAAKIYEIILANRLEIRGRTLGTDCGSDGTEFCKGDGSVHERRAGQGSAWAVRGQPETPPCRDQHPYTAPVGSYPPNDFGLYDIGNVYEWIQDCWPESYLAYRGYEGAPTDGKAWVIPGCNLRGVRGGSWDTADVLSSARSAARGSFDPTARIKDVGFRVARTLNE